MQDMANGGVNGGRLRIDRHVFTADGVKFTTSDTLSLGKRKARGFPGRRDPVGERQPVGGEHRDWQRLELGEVHGRGDALPNATSTLRAIQVDRAGRPHARPRSMK
jgi:hypothetical protein